MTANEIPNAFVWTKIQAEAGQSVDRILNRKELERQSGGTFWWGIGESKAEKIRLLLGRKPSAAVIFSKMLSPPHRRDSNPDGVLLWDVYETAKGRISLPPHAIVTSRAHDKNGKSKSRHYALVCSNQDSLLGSGGGKFDSGLFRNLGEGGKSVGSSQITAVVERADCNSKGLSYAVTARATLVAPYAVQLAVPRELSASELRLLEDASLGTMSTNDWIAVSKRLRRAL